MAGQYTVFNVITHEITGRVNHIPFDGVGDHEDWIVGDFSDVFYRIDPETCEPYPFIRQDQLPWLIRKECRRRLQAIGATDSDVLRWQAAKSMFEMIGEAEIDGMAYSHEAFTALLTARKSIMDSAKELTAMNPMPQDYADESRWSS